MKYPPIAEEYIDDGFIELLTNDSDTFLSENICGYLYCGARDCLGCPIFISSNEDIINEYSDILVEYKLKKLEL